MAADEEAEELLAGAHDESTLEAWIVRREHGEPLAWITGTQRFCGRQIRVDGDVYVPRPQSEELARRAADVLDRDGGPALDLCTGSGAIAHHLMATVPKATVVATDVDRTRCPLRPVERCARRPGRLGRPVRRQQLRHGDGRGTVRAHRRLALLPADVQRYEPRRALDGGPDGLEVVRRIAGSARRVLRPDGWLFLELGRRPGPTHGVGPRRLGMAGGVDVGGRGWRPARAVGPIGGCSDLAECGRLRVPLGLASAEQLPARIGHQWWPGVGVTLRIRLVRATDLDASACGGQTRPGARDQRVRRQDAEGPESGAVLFNAAVVTWEPWRT